MVTEADRHACSPYRGSAAAAPAAAAHARSGAPLLPSSALGGGIGSAGMDWHDYDLLRASGAATVHGYYGGGTAGGYHDEVGRKHGPTARVKYLESLNSNSNS